MTLKKNIANDTMIVCLSGRLDSSNSKELGNIINSDIDSVNTIILDLSEAEYLSSAALRIILTIQQAVDEKGDAKFIVKNPNDFIYSIFESTGFIDFLTIEND